jgi:hypothetical protein
VNPGRFFFECCQRGQRIYRIPLHVLRTDGRSCLYADRLADASNLWKAASAEQKQRLQQVLFPEALTYSGGNYRTGVTCLLFSGMQTHTGKKEGLVALPGIEPGF